MSSGPFTGEDVMGEVLKQQEKEIWKNCVIL